MTIKQNREKLDFPLLSGKLAKYPGGASALLGSAKGRTCYSGSSLSKAVALIICELYNNGKKSAAKIEVL